MSYTACRDHTYRVDSCADCTALANSLSLRMMQRARAAVPTPDEQGKLDKVAQRFSLLGRDDMPMVVTDVNDDGVVTRIRTLPWKEMVDSVERQVQGEVE